MHAISSVAFSAIGTWVIAITVKMPAIQDALTSFDEKISLSFLLNGRVFPTAMIKHFLFTYLIASQDDDF